MEAYFYGGFVPGAMMTVKSGTGRSAVRHRIGGRQIVVIPIDNTFLQ